MRIALLVVALALVIPACGAADSTDDGKTTPAETPNTQPETPSEPPEAPEVPAPPGDTPANPSGDETIVLDVDGMH